MYAFSYVVLCVLNLINGILVLLDLLGAVDAPMAYKVFVVTAAALYIGGEYEPPDED